MRRSKLIAKRKHAKNRTLKKKKFSQKKQKKKMNVPEEIYEQQHPGFNKLPEKKKKSIRQKIKNRISAQESRD